MVSQIESTVMWSPIVSSYDCEIRQTLQFIQKLRKYNIVEEPIELMTIVVIGDKYSGKSSVIGSLSQITLPQNTRVPLIMRLQNHPTTELFLEYNGKVVPTHKDHLLKAINLATDDMAGRRNGTSHTPLTLTVRSKHIPNLTMVDLPGTTDQTKDIIMEYIKPKTSIILNVLSASEKVSTSQSMKMARTVDETGERTLVVITKSDESPKGVDEKVTSGVLEAGLGYVCVRNRIGAETYDEGEDHEYDLFTHPLLSKIVNDRVGSGSLADRLIQILEKSMSRNFTGVVKKIDDKLAEKHAECNKLPKIIPSVIDATVMVMRMVGQVKEALRKNLLGEEFTYRRFDVARRLEYYSHDLANSKKSNLREEKFLAEELNHLEDISFPLPNFLSKSVFMPILKQKIDGISHIPVKFMECVWDDVKYVVVDVLRPYREDYFQLEMSTSLAGFEVVERMKEHSISRVKELLEMEKLTDYTSDPAFETKWNALMEERDGFLMERRTRSEAASLSCFGEVDIRHLWCQEEWRVAQAFEMKMKMEAYWDVVVRRVVDSMALQLQLSFHKLVHSELEDGVVREVLGPDKVHIIERIVEDSRAVAAKRAILLAHIKKLEFRKRSIEMKLRRAIEDD